MADTKQQIPLMEYSKLLVSWFKRNVGRDSINNLSRLSGFEISSPETENQIFYEIITFHFAATIGIFIYKYPDTEQAKQIVGGFVDEIASKLITPLTQKDPNFREIFDKRIQIYLESFKREDRTRRVGAIFLNGLGIKDRDNPYVTSPAQIALQTEVGTKLLAPTADFDRMINLLTLSFQGDD